MLSTWTKVLLYRNTKTFIFFILTFPPTGISWSNDCHYCLFLHSWARSQEQLTYLNPKFQIQNPRITEEGVYFSHAIYRLFWEGGGSMGKAALCWPRTIAPIIVSSWSLDHYWIILSIWRAHLSLSMNTHFKIQMCSQSVLISSSGS